MYSHRSLNKVAQVTVNLAESIWKKLYLVKPMLIYATPIIKFELGDLLLEKQIKGIVYKEVIAIPENQFTEINILLSVKQQLKLNH